MEAKEPLKKMPSTAAKATRRCAKVEFWSAIHFRAQSAFFRMQGTAEPVSQGNTRVERLASRRLTGVNGVEKVCTLLLLFDVCVDE